MSELPEQAAPPIRALMSTRPSLPPQVLVTSDPTGKALKDVDWLIRRHAVTILPSIASLKVLRGRTATSSAPKPLIGFADPVFNKNQQPPVRRVATNVMVTKAVRGGVADVLNLVTALDPLPETADELQRVAASVGATEADIILGPKATETRVKQTRLEDYRIIYFATHGLLAGEVAKLAKLNAEPALVLSLPDNPTPFDDGLLTASEAAQLKLNADWVVLSACNTASGDGSGAEALSGLASAFFYAGGRSLLVSHWQAEVDSSAQLMIGTFAALAADPNLSHGEALQKAMLAMIDDPTRPWAKPKFWAPFVVVGEPAKPRD
jgi:CHAT domain-containing protein